MRILVAIANYGTKNRKFAERLLVEYRSMSFDVHVVILSEAEKDFGDDVEVLVGFPSEDPRSLPFAHKRLFAERIDDYDLFIYSEDDTLIREQNIRAFVEATEVLPADEVAGFIRYEVGPDGERYYSSVHTIYHLEPGSLRRRGTRSFASFTNLHSACFILTRAQLRRAIESGGFLVEPYFGRYDMLCTAATDPYTRCGLRRVLCVSPIEDFELHHLPNVYIGKTGVPVEVFHEQIRALEEIQDDPSKHRSLVEAPTGLVSQSWDKQYYEPVREDVLELVPPTARRVLSVGSGWGATEIAIAERGSEVTLIPMDWVIAAAARAKGLRVLAPDFEQSLSDLKGEEFDCLLFCNILQYVKDPDELLSRFRAIAAPGARLVVTAPNFSHIGLLRRRWRGGAAAPDLRVVGNFARSGVQNTSRRRVAGWLRRSGFTPVAVRWRLFGESRRLAQRTGGLFNDWLARELIVAAETRNGRR